MPQLDPLHSTAHVPQMKRGPAAAKSPHKKQRPTCHKTTQHSQKQTWFFLIKLKKKKDFIGEQQIGGVERPKLTYPHEHAKFTTTCRTTINEKN